jgi:hypothetical protein
VSDKRTLTTDVANILLDAVSSDAGTKLQAERI